MGMNPESFLPLTPQAYALLLTLGPEPMHGLGIIRSFEERTGQKNILLPGSLYNTMARMIDMGLVEAAEPPPDEEDGRRRYYRATALGRQVVVAESARLGALLELAPAPARGKGG